MASDPGLLAILRALAERERVDWDGLDSAVDATDLNAILRELRVVNEIANFNRTLQDSSQGDVTASWSGGSRATPGAISPPGDRPATWGHLRMLAHVGRGSFADVYRAWDTHLDREVALKLLRNPEPTPNPDSSVAIGEARLLAKVRHPGVVTVYGAQRIDAQVGIWTEFIHGRTLEHIIRDDGRMNADEATAIGIDLCRALEAVHLAGLLHRDIKAPNVMREHTGRIVLMDLGAGSERLSGMAAGTLTGTPLYLAPECWSGTTASVQSDIYSLGVLLYYLVTRAYPVQARTLDALREAHRSGSGTPLREARPDLALRFTESVDRALARQPSHRYDRARDFEAALTRALPASAQTPSRSSPTAALWLATVASLVAFLVINAADRRGDNGDGGRMPQPMAGADAMTMRKLSPEMPAWVWGGTVSRDGRFMLYTDLDVDLAVWEIGTTVVRKITRKSGSSPEGALGESVLSPDNQRVAYMWWSRDGSYDLLIGNIDGTGRRVLIPREAADYPAPIEWSADGREILCWLQQRDGRVDLALVPVDGSPRRVLQTFRSSRPRQMSVSPDGQWVVYDLVIDAFPRREQLMIVGLDGGPARVLIAEPVNNFTPFWTPDGAHVFFISDRARTLDGWIVPVSNGVAQGEPKLVMRNMGGVSPMGFTDQGAMYYQLDTSTLEVYTATIGPGGQPAGSPARVLADVIGGHVNPTWSPDGTSLAFISRVPTMRGRFHRGGNRVTVVDFQSGRRSDVIPALAELDLAPPRWSPDGRTMLVRGVDRLNRPGIFRMSVDTGAVDPAIVYPHSVESDYGGYRWLPGGDAFVYRHQPRGLVERNVETGGERTVVAAKPNNIVGFSNFDISPDGKSIGFVATVREGQESHRAVMVQDAGATPRVLLKAPVSDVLSFQAWSPGGRTVFWTQYRAGDKAIERPHTLWQIATSGGAAEPTGVRIPGHTQVYGLSLSPDGRRIAYTLGSASSEMWIVERFLPAIPGVAR